MQRGHPVTVVFLETRKETDSRTMDYIGTLFYRIRQFLSSPLVRTVVSIVDQTCAGDISQLDDIPRGSLVAEGDQQR